MKCLAPTAAFLEEPLLILCRKPEWSQLVPGFQSPQRLKKRYMNFPQTGIPASGPATIEHVFVEVILGRPTAQCRHLGICTMKSIRPEDLRPYSDRTCGNICRGYALASCRPDAYFELAFLKGLLDPHTFERHFAGGSFRLEEDYTASLAGMKARIHIRKGIYRIHFSETLLRIQFEL